MPREHPSALGTAETVVSTADSGAVYPVQCRAPYDGRTAWDAYHTQFEMLVEVNRWSEAEKATFSLYQISSLYQQWFIESVMFTSVMLY